MTKLHIFIVYVVLIVSVIIAFVFNAIKLSDCDFNSPYRCEFVHGIGLTGIPSIITVWFDSDNVD